MKRLFYAACVAILGSLGCQAQTLKSGPEVGEECPAFDPQHVWGPDRGTHACPMCKYGYGQGILIWWNTDAEENIGLLVKRIDEEIALKGLQRIRAFVMYMNPDGKPISEIRERLVTFAKTNQLNKVAITYIPSPTDAETAALYHINPDKDVRNTVVVYRSRSAYAKHINFEVNELSIRQLLDEVDNASKQPAQD